MKIYDIIILGGGASALACASKLNKNLSVAIVDINSKTAQKLKISGGGKCNFTASDISSQRYLGDSELIDSILSIYPQEELLRELKQEHLAFELRKNRYYFCKNSSSDIISIFSKKAHHAKLLLNHEIFTLFKKNELFYIRTSGGELLAKRVVVATGAKSYSSLGASDIGLSIAKSFGIAYKDFSPALVGLTVQKEQFWMKELSGISTPVVITVGEKVISEEMLFAHKGISGPAVLSASLYWERGNIIIDFLPSAKTSELCVGKKLISSALNLPKRLSMALLNAVGMEDKPCDKLTKDDHQKLAMLHSYSFAPAGNFGYSKAEVCKGGIKASELNFFTLESLHIKNLYFIGEVVDVTGELGGYNLQWAFSSGAACAEGINAQ